GKLQEWKAISIEVQHKMESHGWKLNKATEQFEAITGPGRPRHFINECIADHYDQMIQQRESIEAHFGEVGENTQQIRQLIALILAPSFPDHITDASGKRVELLNPRDRGPIWTAIDNHIHPRKK
ncbi:hypothetical protein ACFL6R_05065, partial [Gemmatimonadota bacterium]